MRALDLYQNIHLNKIAIRLRVMMTPTWHEAHPDLNCWHTLDRITILSRQDNLHDNAPEELLLAFTDVVIGMSQADASLTITPDDLAWLIGMISDRDSLALSLMIAKASTKNEWLSPAEAAAATGTAESGWRNRAAAGQIPGAIKKGKQWLIPACEI